MFSIVPVVWCKAYVYDPLKVDKNVYICPVYKTVFRGPTIVFDA